MPVTRAVVLVIDRLGAAWLGPYGNTWLDAPNFNRLAAESILFETAITDSTELETYCHSAWLGRHAMHPRGATEIGLAELATRAGGASILLTDEPSIAAHPLARSFSQCHALPTTEPANAAEGIEQTGLFAFFEAARSLIQKDLPDGLLWLHSRGMSGPWDAPLELRYQFADDEDPAPPTFVQPPSDSLAANYDPDELLGYGQAYAGQVALADMCLGMLLDALDDHPLRDQTMLIVTSPRGYPLGEHRRVGNVEPALYGELIQVPLLIRSPGLEPARVQQIVQPPALPAIVAKCCGWASDLAERGEGWFEKCTAQGRGGVAYSGASHQRAIRTPAWFLRESTDDRGERRHELFAKPDDRWEANEVSSLCGEAVELLAGELARFKSLSGDHALAETPPLAELLSDIWR